MRRGEVRQEIVNDIQWLPSFPKIKPKSPTARPFPLSPATRSPLPSPQQLPSHAPNRMRMTVTAGATANATFSFLHAADTAIPSPCKGAEQVEGFGVNTCLQEEASCTKDASQAF